MNDRIKELAEQAGSYAYKQEALFDILYIESFKEKFAELIVRECADLFDKNETGVRLPEYRIHDCIMIHFGLY